MIGDYATRWTEAYVLPNQHAETVTKTLLHEFISRLGCPLQLKSDQGRNFESELFGEVCRLQQNTKMRSNPFRPESNGLVKRFNLTLERMICSFVNKNEKD